MRSPSRSALPLVLALLSACGEDPAWVGSYVAQGTWNISGPLSGGRTVGDAVADLLLDDLVGASGAPDFVKDEVEDYLGSLIRHDLKAAIDANVPAALAPDGAMTVALASALTEVGVESIIVLSGDEDELQGKETVTALEFVIGDQRHRIEAGELTGEQDKGIVSSWTGKQVADGKLSFKTHPVEIRYGKLVRRVAEELLLTAKLSGLDLGLASALSCATLVQVILDGDNGLEISVAGWSYTISASKLESLCAATMSLAEERALGQFALDSRLEVGGRVLWTEPASGDPLELQSAADFGGIVNVLPGSLAPKVSVSFSAIQQ